jgi:pimeloyl-ACP methyl ester carboxylesterase
MGPAMRAGLAVGDVVRAVDGAPVRDAEAFRAALAMVCEGDRAALTVERHGRERVVELVADARPVERYEGLDVRLGEAANGDVRLRTIAVSPRGEGPWPCVYFVQGYGCGSVERPAGATARDAVRGLVEALARSGLCVWRLEKRGVGDSEGPHCADASLAEEYGDFAAGLDALMRDARVDARDVVVLGHSLGALHAPSLALHDRRVRGVALYGGGVLPWSEYLVESVRRQGALAGTSREHTERLADSMARFARAVLVEGRSLEETFAAEPDLAAMRAALGVDARGRLHERGVDYWRAVQRADFTGPLAEANVAALALWGSADWLSSRDEHEALARAARGRFEVVHGADHGFFWHTTESDSYAARWSGRYCAAVGEALVRWVATTRA